MSNEDVVGYKRPPKATRFKPGVSGNPSGKAKRPKSIGSELIAELGELTRVSENGRSVEITKARAIAKELVRLAVSGDLRAATIVLSFTTRACDDKNELSDEPTSDDLALADSFIEREIRRRAAIYSETPKEKPI